MSSQRQETLLTYGASSNGNSVFPYHYVFSDLLQNYVPTPFVTLSAQNPVTGEWYTFETQFDSGSTITVLPKSLASQLGIKLASGYRITLIGVGGARTPAYVHPLVVKVGGKQFEVYVAFATTEVEPLLGRFTVLDQIGQINLNNAQQITEFQTVQLKSLPALPTSPTIEGNSAVAVISIFTPIILAMVMLGVGHH